jgi:hypothetical protein
MERSAELHNRQDHWDAMTTYDLGEVDHLFVESLMPLMCGGLFKTRCCFVSTARRRLFLAS